jgi:2-oxoglutarate dehydrogenase E1 component
MIRSFQVFGHKNANLDPLGIKQRPPHPELQPERWGFTEEDMTRDISQLEDEGLSPFISGRGKYTLADLLEDLRKTYCSTVGVEYMHIQDVEQCEMIRSHLEKHKGSGSAVYTSAPDVRVKNLKRLLWATCFEEFLHSRWTEKR